MINLYSFLLIGTLYFVQLLGLSDPTSIVETTLKKAMGDDNIPGAAVGLIYDGKVYTYLYGFSDIGKHTNVTPDTIFEIASITKVFTSTLLSIEIKNGKMDLKDSLTKFLPIPSSKTSPINNVTLMELATHTSSLPRMPPAQIQGAPYTFESLMHYLEGWTPGTAIGTQYLYSNLGFGVLGMAVARSAGKPYFTLLQEDILNPLGMHSTFVTVPNELLRNYAQGYSKSGNPVTKRLPSLLVGGGALRSTLNDMIVFLKANLGLVGPQKLLEAMQFTQHGIYKVNPHLVMGLGWQNFTQHNLQLIDKNGGVEGFSSYIGMVPNKNLGVIILFNKGKTQATRIGRDILFRLAKENN